MGVSARKHDKTYLLNGKQPLIIGGDGGAGILHSEKGLGISFFNFFLNKFVKFTKIKLLIVPRVLDNGAKNVYLY